MTVSVCALSSQNEGTAVSFISVSGDINLKLLNECFELGPFNGLYKPSPEDLTETAPEPEGERTTGDTNTISPQGSTGEVQYEMNLTQKDPCVQNQWYCKAITDMQLLGKMWHIGLIQDVDQTKVFDQGGVTEIPNEVSEVNQLWIPYGISFMST